MTDDKTQEVIDMIPPIGDAKEKAEPTEKIDLQGRWAFDEKLGTFQPVPDPPAKPDPDAVQDWDVLVPRCEAGKPGDPVPDEWHDMVPAVPGTVPPQAPGPLRLRGGQIGRASCRERV